LIRTLSATDGAIVAPTLNLRAESTQPKNSYQC
jgi:hypothetical protein